MAKKELSGMSLSVTEEERELVNKLQKLTGLKRTPVMMSLVRAELRRIEANEA